MTTSRAGDLDDAFLVVLAAEMLHDIGNMVHRIGHIEYSAILVSQLLPCWLSELYPDPEQEQLILGFIPSCIASHDGSPPPLTVKTDVPIEIAVYLSNSAGIFQVQEILARKVVVTPLKDRVRIVVSARPESPLADQRIIQKVVFTNGRFRVAQDE